MRLFLTGILFVCFAVPNCQIKLYPIYDGGLYGFIDSSGSIKLPPQFNYADTFSQGRALVRLGGYCGYIDVNGKMAIPAKFDFGLPFHNNRALAKIGSKIYLIDTAGRIVFTHAYTAMGAEDNVPLFRVGTRNGKIGFINSEGKVIVKPVYKAAGSFNDSLCVVTGFSKKTKKQSEKVGVINSRGNVVVPFGKYSMISGFKNGYTSVAPIDNVWDKRTKLIDTKGRLACNIEDSGLSFESLVPYVKENAICVERYLINPDTVKVWHTNERYTFKGVTDATGKLLFIDSSFDYVSPFENGFAFVRLANKKYGIINRQGKLMAGPAFNAVQLDGFCNGLSFWGYWENIRGNTCRWQLCATAFYRWRPG